jgi:hypothetical protein
MTTYSNDIGKGHDRNQDSRCNDHLPVRQTNVLRLCGRFVQISKHSNANDQHGKTETAEAVSTGEHWPIAFEVAWEERKLRHNEEQTDYCGDDMSRSVEEIEL